MPSTATFTRNGTISGLSEAAADWTRPLRRSVWNSIPGDRNDAVINDTTSGTALPAKRPSSADILVAAGQIQLSGEFFLGGFAPSSTTAAVSVIARTECK